MKTGDHRSLLRFAGWQTKTWPVCATALVSFAFGLLVQTHRRPVTEVKAAAAPVFELMIYHTIPGKVPELETIFRDVSKLQEKHGLHVLGYWVPHADPARKDTSVYVVAHPSLEEAQKNWDALHADPAFLPYRKAAIPLIRKTEEKYNVDEIYMRPADSRGARRIWRRRDRLAVHHDCRGQPRQKPVSKLFLECASCE